MKLIGSYTSPFARKIAILLQEKDVAFSFVNDPPGKPESRVPDYNPLGKIPVLLPNEGGCWFDSPLLAEYIELTYPQPAFLPADPLSRLQVRQLEAAADGVTDAAILIVMELLRPTHEQSAAFVDKQRLKISRGLNFLEQASATQQYCNQPQLNLADIAIVCLLDYLLFREVDVHWPKHCPHLHALFLRLGDRSSVIATYPHV
ncbi:MAG: glutathione S-transferase [Plesiomonas sp.]